MLLKNRVLYLFLKIVLKRDPFFYTIQIVLLYLTMIKVMDKRLSLRILLVFKNLVQIVLSIHNFAVTNLIIIIFKCHIFSWNKMWAF